MYLYCSFALDFEPICVGLVGGFEAGTPVLVEPSLKYHPGLFEVLTLARYPGWGQCMVGSLTGAVSSQRKTEKFEGARGAGGRRAGGAGAGAGGAAGRAGRAGAGGGHS